MYATSCQQSMSCPGDTGGRFILLDATHSCEADPSLQVHIPLYSLVKQKIKQEVFVPAANVVEPLMFKTYKAIPRKQRRKLLPKMGNIARATKRAR